MVMSMVDQDKLIRRLLSELTVPVPACASAANPNNILSVVVVFRNILYLRFSKYFDHIHRFTVQGNA